MKDVNLRNIKMLKDNFPQYIVGYSDHTVGIEVAAASVALGAEVIEKHFTLDNSTIGMDNQMATEPEEMKALVNACHSVYTALGRYERVVSENEKLQAKKMRRSVVTGKNMKEGEIISSDAITLMRPGDGIPPTEESNVIGHKLKKDYPKGYKLKIKDIE